MKSFSLELFPQETLYSYVVRARLLSGEPSSSDFLREFIGTAHCQLYSHFPSYVPVIEKEARLGANWIIDHHTLLPYFTAFLSSNVATRSRNDLLQGQAKELHSRLSIIANRIPQIHEQKFCPVCANSDIQRFGVAYWHVCHQLPFIRVCPEHNLWLIGASVKRGMLCLPPQQFNEHVECPCLPEKVQLFADISHQLYENNLEPLNPSRIVDCYLTELKLKGFCSCSGSVRQQAWLRSLKCFWNDSLSSELSNALFNNRAGLNYPRCIFYHPKARYHPVKHILVIGQLYGSLGGFLQRYEDKAYQPNLHAPSEHIFLPRVQEFNVGILFCELGRGSSLRQAAKRAEVSVGFAKSIALQNGFNVERRAQWIFATERKQILNWLMEGRKTQDIAKAMECSVGAVEQLLTQNPPIKRLRAKLRFQNKRHKHRKQILEFLSINPSARRSDFQRCVGASYSWCFKNDKTWLYQHLPTEVPRRERYNGGKK